MLGAFGAGMGHGISTGTAQGARGLAAAGGMRGRHHGDEHFAGEFHPIGFAAAAGQGCRGAGDPHHRRAASIPAQRLQCLPGAARRKSADPQLRPWRGRHFAFLGHFPARGGACRRGQWRKLRGNRRRRHGPDHRAARPGPGLEGGDLRERLAAGYDFQRRRRPMVANLDVRRGTCHPRFPRPVRPGHGIRLPLFPKPRRAALRCALDQQLQFFRRKRRGKLPAPLRRFLPATARTRPPRAPLQRRRCAPLQHDADRASGLPARGDARLLRRRRRNPAARIRQRR